MVKAMTRWAMALVKSCKSTSAWVSEKTSAKNSLSRSRTRRRRINRRSSRSGRTNGRSAVVRRSKPLKRRLNWTKSRERWARKRSSRWQLRRGTSERNLTYLSTRTETVRTVQILTRWSATRDSPPEMQATMISLSTRLIKSSAKWLKGIIRFLARSERGSSDYCVNHNQSVRLFPQPLLNERKKLYWFSYYLISLLIHSLIKKQIIYIDWLIYWKVN